MLRLRENTVTRRQDYFSPAGDKFFCIKQQSLQTDLLTLENICLKLRISLLSKFIEWAVLNRLTGRVWPTGLMFDPSCCSVSLQAEQVFLIQWSVQTHVGFLLFMLMSECTALVWSVPGSEVSVCFHMETNGLRFLHRSCVRLCRSLRVKGQRKGLV